MNNIENIEIFVGHNWDNLSDEFKSDWASLAKQRNKETGEVDQDLLNKFLIKHKTDFMHNQGGEIVDFNAGKSLIERMKADNVDFSDTSSVYDQNLARKYNVADPNTVREERAKEKARLEKEEADKKRVEEYKRELAERYARQKAVDEHQHSYLGMSKDNLANKALNWLADLVISDDTKRSIVEDPNNTSGILANGAVDIIGTGLDFTPGYGKISKGVSYLGGPILRTGRDIAEDKSAIEIGKNRGFDFLGNLALGEGLKGLPGIKDLGPVHKIEEKFPTEQWSKKVKQAIESKNEVGVGKIYKHPPEDIKNFEDLISWIDNQPNEYGKIYQDILEKSENLNEALEKINEKVSSLAHDNTLKVRNNELAERWLKENPTKYRSAVETESLIKGAEKYSTKIPFKNTPYKTKNPEKAKLKTERDVIDWAKEQFSRQWEAGFKPKDGILLKAWEEWNKEN